MAVPKPGEQAIFNVARRIEDPDARRHYLEQACGEDRGLRARIEALLRVHEENSTFLRTLAEEVRADFADPVREGPGTVIGPYKLLQQIGEGGMGTVFLAEQAQPVQRQVALKLITPGLDSRQVLARFEVEQRALALMDHPNIAKVLDAGTTQAGRPYFVMELVKGVPITRYCDEHRLTPGQRLELFVLVCQAVQHAHQKGVIHRDLKPSNILVAVYDGQPVPKIIDFGVAKAIGQKLTERTLVTALGSVLGTPQYMSPEQAKPNQLDIDTRSDIYSLGVLLYELLTGTTPVPGERIKKASLIELLLLIREEELPRPSLRLSTSEELSLIAANRGLEPKKLRGLVQGDLDWIVMKCLEKDRTRRYETANGLARDLERYLRDEPVGVSPPGAGYWLRKFARRHKKVLATVAALLFLSILAAVALVAEGIFYNQRLRAERDYAVKNFQRARQAVEQMLTEVAEEELAFEPRMEDKRRRLLERALAFYQEFLDERPADPRLRQETARAHQRMGDVLRLLGRHDEARAAYGEAIALHQTLALAQPTEPAYRRHLADCHNFQGEVLRLASRPEEAEAAYQQARTLQEQLRAESPPEPAYQEDLARTYYNLGILSRQTSRLEDAQAFLRQALLLSQDLVRRFPALRDYRHHLARSYLNLGTVLRTTNRLEEAEAMYDQAIRLLQQLGEEARDNPAYAHELAASSNNLGNLLAQRQRYADAQAAHERARALLQRLAQDFPRVPVYRQQLANTLNSLGSALALEVGHWRSVAPVLCLERQLGASLALVASQLQQVRLAAAQHAYDQARVRLTELVADPSGLPDYWGDLGLTHGNLGWLLTEQDHWGEARAQFAQAISCLENALKPNPRQPDYLGALRDQYRNLAETLVRLGDPVAATQAAVALTQVLGADEQDVYIAACFVARSAVLLEQPVLAEAYRNQAIQLLKQAIQSGFQDAAKLKTDSNLQALRDRASFRELVTQVEGISPSLGRATTP